MSAEITAHPVPADRVTMVREVHCKFFQLGTYTGAEAVADLVLSWLAYERQQPKAERAKVEWQPIDTAPEHEVVLIFCEDNPRYGCDGGLCWDDSVPGIFVAICEDGRWTSDLVEFALGFESSGPCTVTQELCPIHWMPLPESPS